MNPCDNSYSSPPEKTFPWMKDYVVENARKSNVNQNNSITRLIIRMSFAEKSLDELLRHPMSRIEETSQEFRCHFREQILYRSETSPAFHSFHDDWKSPDDS